MTDISKAVTLLLDYNESFAYKDMSEIRMWLNEGCDMDKDIIPAMMQTIARNKGITAIAYFRPIVHKLKQARIDTEMAKQQRKATPVGDDATKAKNMAWCRKTGYTPVGYDPAWLSQYELQHGRVEA